MTKCSCDCHWILAALLDSFKDEPPTSPWGACIPMQLLEKAKKTVQEEKGESNKAPQ